MSVFRGLRIFVLFLQQVVAFGVDFMRNYSNFSVFLMWTLQFLSNTFSNTLSKNVQT